MRPRTTRSTGNVFRDVGFPSKTADHLKIRADLLISVQEAIAERGLTQRATADLLGVHQPRVSDLMRGKIDLFSIETLIDMLSRMKVRVRVVVRPVRKKEGTA